MLIYCTSLNCGRATLNNSFPQTVENFDLFFDFLPTDLVFVLKVPDVVHLVLVPFVLVHLVLVPLFLVYLVLVPMPTRPKPTSKRCHPTNSKLLPPALAEL